MNRVMCYGLAILLASLILVWGQNLQLADWSHPFTYEADALLILPMVKETVEKGHHWTTPRLGAPGQQTLHDFPVIDHLHFALIWLLGCAIHDPIVVFNLYHALTYPITALLAMLIFRQLGLSLPASFCGSLLYTFLPYHYLRGLHHYFLAAYFVVPLSCYVILRVVQPVPLSRRIWFASVLISSISACAGAYYAFYSCALLTMAALYTVVVNRSWSQAAFAGINIIAISVVGVLNHWPTVIYHQEHGRSSVAHTRYAEETEDYAMKPMQLILPVRDHRINVLAQMASAYDSSFRPLQNENRTTTLGLVGVVALLVLVARMIFPVQPSWPASAITALVGFILVYAIVGGLGSFFSFFVTPQIRCTNRIVVYLAFFLFYFVLHNLDQLRWCESRSRKWLVFSALATVGLLDQLSINWFSAHFPEVRQKYSERFLADRAFFQAIEAKVGGGKVFQLPHVSYPESPDHGNLPGYDPVRGYLHTRQTRWSFGTMKGREFDQIFQEWNVQPLKLLTKLHDWQGVLLDARGYSNFEGEELKDYLDEKLGAENRITHADGQQFFWPIDVEKLPPPSPGPRDEERVRMLWLHGFTRGGYFREPPLSQWCGRTGEALLVNPRQVPVRVKLGGFLRAETQEPTDIIIKGPPGLWNDRQPINRVGYEIQQVMTVPPGRHLIRFEANPAKDWRPEDSRRFVFVIARFTITEQSN